MWLPFRFAKTTAITLYQPAQLINYFYVPFITYDVEGKKKQQNNNNNNKTHFEER